MKIKLSLVFVCLFLFVCSCCCFFCVVFLGVGLFVGGGGGWGVVGVFLSFFFFFFWGGCFLFCFLSGYSHMLTLSSSCVTKLNNITITRCHIVHFSLTYEIRYNYHGEQTIECPQTNLPNKQTCIHLWWHQLLCCPEIACCLWRTVNLN